MSKVKLEALLEAIHCQTAGSLAFIHPKTGKVSLIGEEIAMYAENNDPDYPDWMKNNIQEMNAYLENPDEFICIPSTHDVNEYEMMEHFVFALADENQKEKLLIAINGKGPFSRFRDTLHFLGITKQWHTFKNNAYKKFAVTWCKSQQLEIIE